MHDSGASHDLIPKVVMERLGLEITRPYKDLYSFDSSRVKCLVLIKDLCVSLTQIPAKCMVMDVVMADVPPKYGMYYRDHGEPSCKVQCRWMGPMPQSQSLANLGDCIERQK